MPMIKLHSSCDISEELRGEISTVLAESIGKPEKYVMVVTSGSDVMMAGTEDDAVYAEVKSIGGLGRVVNHEITMKLCVLLNDHLGIAADRVYVTFAEVPADHWGWNGTIFG